MNLRNIETDHVMDEMGTIIAETSLREFRDKKKATFKHLSSGDGICSWKKTSEAENKSRFGLFANNNASESPFGELTNQAETHSIIVLTNDLGMVTSRQNGHF